MNTRKKKTEKYLFSKKPYYPLLPNPSSAGSNQFNIFGIPDGVYTVTIKSADGDFVGRLVIVE